MSADASLSLFEIPPFLISPALRACRSFNTSLDMLFYDVPTLVEAFRARHEAILTTADDDAPNTSKVLNLSALRNPEGALLVVDPKAAPYVTAFDDVETFLKSKAAKTITIASITGVGSSALGSAALAWNIAEAYGEPVLAIVPGYGVADAMLQGLGGWFGFGLHDFLDTKSNLQTVLAAVAPKTATIGRKLSDSSPERRTLANGGPVFRTGCGSSDVLHDLMKRCAITCVVGHSKGALSIANALGSLPSDRVQGLKIVTLGCPVAETLKPAGATYHQFLGLFDALGALNAWGHAPDAWTLTDHSTNAALPLSMHAEELVDLDLDAPAAEPASGS